MDWIEEKNILFEKLYQPLLLEKGFKKRGWEFYKIIEKNKLAMVVKLTSYSGLPDSTSFKVEIGVFIYQNSQTKTSEITLFNCKIQFNIIKLLYPEDDAFTGNYSYDLGEVYIKEFTENVGDIKILESEVSGAFTGFNVLKIERIAPNYKQNTRSMLDSNRQIVEQEEPYIVRILSNRYDTENLESIYNQLGLDFNKVIEFYELIINPNFLTIDTNYLLPFKIKNKIIELTNTIEVVHNYWNSKN